jgi:sn-glycerol 3-phosphate transport system permease protein
MKKLSLGQVAVYVVLGLAAIPVLFPIYYGFVGAVMGPGDLATYPPALVPHELHWQNIADVFRSVPLGRFYVNSAIQAGVITVAQIVTSILAAYAFAFFACPRRPRPSACSSPPSWCRGKRSSFPTTWPSPAGA